MKIYDDSENVINFIYNGEGTDLEEFLETQQISGRLFRRLYKAKLVLVNGKYQRKGLILKKGDRVSLLMGDEAENIEPEEMSLDIVYEDYDLLILNKQPNIVVHPTKSHQNNTLSNGIAYHFKNNGIKKKIRFVNRLDMDTTGLLIIAKNSYTHQQMALQFENNTVEKKYLAVVSGIIKDDEGYIDLPIGRQEDRSVKKTVTESGQDAKTSYRVVERYKSATLVEVQIHTGRSHQIRVHMEHLGHPIIGDSLYYEKSELISRQALHSFYLKAIHPRSKESMEFKASLPYDIVKLINLMKN